MQLTQLMSLQPQQRRLPRHQPMRAPFLRIFHLHWSVYSICLALLNLSLQARASSYYDLAIVAATDGAFSFLGEYPSIADDGTVAFMGRKANGEEGIYVGTGSSAPVEITANNSLGARIFGPAVQINNQHQVIAYHEVAARGSRLYLWNSDRNISPRFVASGGIASADDFGDVYKFPSVNNIGQTAFVARPKDAQNYVLATPNGSGFNTATFIYRCH
jgi:hypothetical protein